MIGLALAAMLTAAPANVSAVVAQAQPGDTVQLSPGDYAPLVLKGRTGLTLKGVSAASVVFHAVDYRGCVDVLSSSSITVSTITCQGDGKDPGIIFRDGSGNILAGAVINGPGTGVYAGGMKGVGIYGTTINGSTGDGVDIAGSSVGHISGLHCSGFNDASGVHPDCIQFFMPVPPYPKISSNFEVDHGTIGPGSQGVSGYQGVDGIYVHDMAIVSSYVNAIGLYHATNTRVENNHISTAPGAPWQATINMVDAGAGTRRCDNSIALYLAPGAAKPWPAITDAPCAVAKP